MSGTASKRPSKKWLESRIHAGDTRAQIGAACGARADTVSRWCFHYEIVGAGKWVKHRDVTCGQAIVVALLVEDGEPEQFALPGGEVVGRDEARRVAVAMDDMMTGRLSDK